MNNLKAIAIYEESKNSLTRPFYYNIGLDKRSIGYLTGASIFCSILYMIKTVKNKLKYVINLPNKKEDFLPGGIELVKLNPGLENFGNTCFANSLIQGLSSCTYFVEYLIQNKYDSIFPESLMEFNNKLLSLLLSISSYNSDVYVIDKTLQDFISLFEHDNFDFVNQQDSHEFFLFISEKFHKIENYKKKIKTSLAFVDQSMIEINYPFTGKILSYLKCLSCQEKGNFKINEFFDISLDTANYHQETSLSELITEFSRGYRIDDVYCTNCSLNLFSNSLDNNSKNQLDNFLQNFSKSQIKDIEDLGNIKRMYHD